MGKLNRAGQRGIALPVMLIILVVMLISSVYLLKSGNSSTLTASNLAYDSALSKAADLGLHSGYMYLASKTTTQLEQDDLANAYVATYDTTQSVNDDGFWTNAKTVVNSANGSASGDRIQYIVHRACSVAGNTSATGNACVMTSANVLTNGTSVAAGESLDVKSTVLTSPPQIHYIVTARIFGPRGGNVVNQMIVLIHG